MEKQRSQRYWFSIEVVGELVLLLIAGGLFAYLFVESFQWEASSALLPRVAIVIGTPFWFIRVITVLMKTRKTSNQIMDIGFRLGSDSKAAGRRFMRISGLICIWYLTIWLLGFHLMFPIGMFYYLFVYGKAGWLWSGIVGLAFLALIVGLYDMGLNAVWHEPVILRALGLT